MSGSPAALRSALYEGTVTHRRAEPVHRFTNRVALPLLFLDEMSELRAVHPLVDLDPSPHRRRRPAAMRFHRDDYLPSDAPTVQEAVEETVAQAGGSVRGPVAMLGHVRTWGWLFNPLTLYYCFDPSGLFVEWTVLEVSNTPWHERCRYVVGPPGEHRFAKAMHVSPFLPAQGSYTLRYSPPEEGLLVSLDVEASAPGRAVSSVGRTEPPTTRTTARGLPGAAAPAARPRRTGTTPVVVPAHDGPRVGWHLRAGAAARCPAGTLPPAPGSRWPGRDLPGDADGPGGSPGVRP